MTSKELQKKEKNLTAQERFTSKIIQQFTAQAGEIELSPYQKRLIQNYYIYTDKALATAEESRSRKKDNHNPPIIWSNVNLNSLALDLVYYSKVGLDMAQDNHLFPIPYYNSKTKKYDLNLMPGYNGIAHIATEYAKEKPLDVITELVYENDTFIPHKRGGKQKFDDYTFDIPKPFDRGKIVGGFGYIQYENEIKNKLLFISKKDMDKRKPAYASAEFWGGEKYNYATKKKEKVEGWQDEMYLKTLKRFVYSSKNIPLDPQKIEDAAFKHVKEKEEKMAELEAQIEIEENANTIDIETITEEPEVNKQTGEIIEPEQEEKLPFEEDMPEPAEIEPEF